MWSWLACVVALQSLPGDSLTLAAALREARSDNAQLPVAHYGVAAAEARLRAAEGLRWPALWAGGDVHEGAPVAYAAGDARLQLIAEQVLYDGGARGAGVRAARADAQSARARYRRVEKDLDLEVRGRFSELVALRDELAIRREGIERIRTYLSGIEARQAAGQGVAGDVLRTQVRLAQEQANVTAVEVRRGEARLELNELLGRDLAAPLTIATPPPPAPPPGDSTGTWVNAPEIRAAAADHEAARAAVGVVGAGRRPSLALSANAGAQPLLDRSGSGAVLNTGSGLGVEVTVSLAWPLWDRGVQRARLAEARTAAAQAGQIETVVRRQAELAWRRALDAMRSRYREVELRSRTVPLARDSYLEAESLYRGGAATTLEVLDAYASWIDGSTAYLGAVLAYRLAAAQFERWSTP